MVQFDAKIGLRKAHIQRLNVRKDGHHHLAGAERAMWEWPFGGEQIGDEGSIQNIITTSIWAELLIGELHARDRAGMRPARWKRKASTPIKV